MPPSKKKQETCEIKSKGLFDHVKHIKQVQDPDYYSTLSVEDIKTFNQYMITRALSMNLDYIETMAYLSKFTNKIPNEAFYKFCIGLLPKSFKFDQYIKSTITKYNTDLLYELMHYFEVSYYDAIDFCHVFFASDDNTEKLKEILTDLGKSETEIKNLIKL